MLVHDPSSDDLLVTDIVYTSSRRLLPRCPWRCVTLTPRCSCWG